MPIPNYLPDEGSPVEQIGDPERAGIIGWEDLTPMAATHSPALISDGNLVYDSASKEFAWQLSTAALRAFFGFSQDQAPYKWAEETQAADISDAVEYADQDYRRINEANAKLTQFRSRLPKVPSNVSTSSIIGNLSGSTAQALGSSDDELLSMLGM